MKNNVWIWNHYATSMFKDRAGRHYWFAENLIEQGYNPTVFCASTIHNSDENIDTGNKKYASANIDSLQFVFVKTSSYTGNGVQRIKNMFAFYKNLFSVSKEYACIHGKPDIILASSVHPLTLVAGIKVARKFGIPCICEVRDLWPESIVAYGTLKRSSILAKVLYQGEKWIYKKANAIVMTWEGGKDYIIDKGWEKIVELAKVRHINNGVKIDSFDRNSIDNEIIDIDLEDKSYKNIVYAGSIRQVNNLGMLLDAAKIIQDQGNSNIRFLIYGSGDESEMLKKRCEDEGIHNVIFKGRVDRKYIPSILKKAYINILHNSSTCLDKYGQSQNKLFEYLAAGNCIVQTYPIGYSICDRYNCGMSVAIQNALEIVKSIIEICNDDDKCKAMGQNARVAAYDYDFMVLTDKLINIIESV